MANPYYYGWNTKFKWAIEDPATYGDEPAAGVFNAQAFMRGITTNLNENVERWYSAGSTYKFNPHKETKGVITPTMTSTFWISKFGTGTAVYDPWILKLPIDYKNEAHDATLWAVPSNSGTAATDCGNEGEPNLGNALLSCTIEIGQTSTNVQRFVGMMVNRMGFRCMRGEKAEWTYDWIGQQCTRETAFILTTAPTEDSEAPLDFADMEVKWKGEDDTLTAITTCVGLEFEFNNNLVPLDTLSDMTVERTIYGIVRGPREISGTLHVNRATTTGQDWLHILMTSSTTAPTNDATTINLGEITVDMATKVKYYLKDVVLGELPMDVTFDKLQELSIPFTARYGYMELTTGDTTGPTNWSQTT